MPLDPRQREGLPEGDQNFLRIIDVCGWHVMMVGLREGDQGPAWAYSIGLHYNFGHPEIIVFGQTIQMDRNFKHS